MPNYIQKKTGIKAEFHHTFGALIVEVDSEGRWYARQINAEDDGTFYDLDVKVENGKVTTGHNLKAVVWGDLHVAQVDPNVVKMAWEGKDCITATHKPEHQVFHDTLDFLSENHHHRTNPFKRFEKHKRGLDDVRQEVEDTCKFVRKIAKRYNFSQCHIVESNHDRALDRWVMESDWKTSERKNAMFLAECVHAKLKFIDEGGLDREFQMFPYWFQRLADENGKCPPVNFVDDDNPLVIMEIDLTHHGDRGINGARGSPAGFVKTGSKQVSGHAHDCGIWEGFLRTGTCSVLDPDYVAGLSSWSHSHCFIYPNGKRALITMWQGKWRA